jgi:hypothetical protein
MQRIPIKSSGKSFTFTIPVHRNTGQGVEGALFKFENNRLVRIKQPCCGFSFAPIVRIVANGLRKLRRVKRL